LERARKSELCFLGRSGENGDLHGRKEGKKHKYRHYTWGGRPGGRSTGQGNVERGELTSGREVWGSRNWYDPCLGASDVQGMERFSRALGKVELCKCVFRFVMKAFKR